MKRITILLFFFLFATLSSSAQFNKKRKSKKDTHNFRYEIVCIGEGKPGTYAIKVLVDEKLSENAKLQGKRLIDNMNVIKEEYPDKVKEVRGRGLLTAFEMFDEPHLDGHKVSVELLNHGVYAKETHHSTVRLAPALTINETQIDTLSDAIRSVVKGL